MGHVDKYTLIHSLNNVNGHSTTYLCHQDVAPPSRLICSNESQKVSDQGAIRSQQGTKPL